MILTCPNCGTQYVVKDGAVPPEGRQVRCAACKHSWHQDPEVATATSGSAPEPIEEAAPAEGSAPPPPEERAADPVAQDESLAEATLIEPRSGPEAEERAFEEAMIEGDAEASVQEVAEPAPAMVDVDEPDASGAAQSGRRSEDWRGPPMSEPVRDMFSPFAEDGEQPRRRSGMITILVLALLLIAAASAFWFLAPANIKAKLGLTSAGATPLQLVVDHKDRQHLESGNELLTVSGRIINPSAGELAVPPLQAQLRDGRGKVVYSWTIQPPAQSLAGGSSASFNSAEVSVPPGGEEVTITFGDGKSSES